jgi:hypothetical protein
MNMFQLLIGVEDEDSCGRSGQCETCPALGLRGTCHKSTRPRRQRTPSWPIRLMPPASEQSPSAFLPAGKVEEAQGLPAESEVFHGNQQRQLWRVCKNHFYTVSLCYHFVISEFYIYYNRFHYAILYLFGTLCLLRRDNH